MTDQDRSASRHRATGGRAARRRRFLPLVWLASAGALLIVAMGVEGTISGFTASINNTTNTAGSATLLMEEDQGATTCLSSAAGTVTAANAGTCATINKFGGNLAMVPGQTVSANISIKNNGSATPATFTLTPSACTQSANGTVNGTATDFCTKLDVTIKSGATTVFTGTAATLASGGMITLPSALIPAPGASTPFTFTVQLDPSADNTYQGLAASEPLLWSFT